LGTNVIKVVTLLHDFYTSGRTTNINIRNYWVLYADFPYVYVKLVMRKTQLQGVSLAIGPNVFFITFKVIDVI
jgi:hypothetical protein